MNATATIATTSSIIGGGTRCHCRSTPLAATIHVPAIHSAVSAAVRTALRPARPAAQTRDPATASGMTTKARSDGVA